MWFGLRLRVIVRVREACISSRRASKSPQLWRGEKNPTKRAKTSGDPSKQRMHAVSSGTYYYVHESGEKVMIPNVIRDHSGTTRREWIISTHIFLPIKYSMKPYDNLEFIMSLINVEILIDIYCMLEISSGAFKLSYHGRRVHMMACIAPMMA